ncbi:hypothetical protein LP420_04115 [Massilia sp. B-10]|nr:hypothetical protein LP420_04115 [Massilia sp. B-10]
MSRTARQRRFRFGIDALDNLAGQRCAARFQGLVDLEGVGKALLGLRVVARKGETGEADFLCLGGRGEGHASKQNQGDAGDGNGQTAELLLDTAFMLNHTYFQVSSLTHVSRLILVESSRNVTIYKKVVLNI